MPSPKPLKWEVVAGAPRLIQITHGNVNLMSDLQSAGR